MSLIVQKFGGTSIANVDRIKSVAQIIKQEVENGNQVIVVLSAMAGVTNQLVGWAHQCVHHTLDPAEYDVVVSSGEQVTCGLMGLVLNDMGISSRSWLAWQIGIHTTDQYKNAEIRNIDKDHILNALKEGQVAIVSGFQGISSDNRLTTLGRGGSDYTAVALAAEFKAERCDIYTDVDGIYTADPRAVTTAKLIKNISYQDALDLANQGARVLQAQSIQMAAQAEIPVRVVSSFHNHDGTLLQKEVNSKKKYIGVASRRDRSLINVRFTEIGINKVEQFRKELENGYIELDYSTHFKLDNNDLRILVSKDDFETTELLINQFMQKNKDAIESITIHSRIAKVALVGKIGNNHDDLKQKIIGILEDKDIQIYHLLLNDEAISLIVAPEDMEESVKLLHENFVLNDSNIKEVA